VKRKHLLCGIRKESRQPVKKAGFKKKDKRLFTDAALKKNNKVSRNPRSFGTNGGWQKRKKWVFQASDKSPHIAEDKARGGAKRGFKA